MKSNASAGRLYPSVPLSRNSTSNLPSRLSPTKLSPLGFTPHASGLFFGIVVCSSTMNRPLLSSSFDLNRALCSYFFRAPIVTT